MSKDKRLRDYHNDYDVNQRTYDEFQKYLSRLSSSENPRLRLADFSQIKEAAKHLVVSLENVNKYTKSDAEFIEKFRPGTEFIVENNETDTGLVTHVYVPYSKHASHKKHEKKEEEEEREMPNSLVPQGILFGYMLLVIVAVWKTTWNDWQFILRW